MITANAIFSGGIGGFLLVIFYAVFTQNAVLSRGLGSSRLTKLIGDDEKDAWLFAVLLLIIQVLCGTVGWMANRWLVPLFGSFRTHLRPLILALSICTVFFLMFLLSVQLFNLEKARRIVRQLPIAAFNCCIMGTMLLTCSQQYSFGQTVAFSIGSAVGYMLSLLLMQAGSRKLDRSQIPESFRGLPTTLVYLGILSLVFYGLIGHSLAV